jgi:hypothetical protein
MVARILAAALVLSSCAGLALADYLQLSVDINNINPFPVPKAGAAGQQGATGQPGLGQGFGMQGGVAQPGFIPGKKGKGKGAMPPPPLVPGNLPPPPPGAHIEKDPLWVTVYLELKEAKWEPDPTKNPRALPVVLNFDLQYGKSAFVPVSESGIPGVPSPYLEFITLKKDPLIASIRKLRGTKDKKDKKNLIQAAGKAWSFGLMKEFHESFKELKEVDAKNPLVAIYQQVQNQLKATPPKDDPSLKNFIEAAKSEGFQSLTVSEKGHYALLTNLPPLPSSEDLIKRRLARLEEEFEAFYYWFALQENVPVPPLPAYRLLGIVVNDPADFYRRNKNWGSQPMVGDGFTPRRENIMVLSAKRLDEAYAVLAQKNKEWLQTPWVQAMQASADELVSGNIWQRVGDRSKLLSLAYLQTLSLMQKGMEDEAERTTLSHEATRQLLTASGVLPHNVAAPEWVLEGLASYFERPFGAVYGSGGLPSWSNFVPFKFHYTVSRTLGKGRDVLTSTISDRYFQIAREASLDLTEPRDKLPENVRDDWERARATSWALVYYLAKEQKMDRLFKYAAELSQMPRDLELNRQALEASFAKAFGLSDSKDALKLDATRLQVFADEWLEFMSKTHLEFLELEINGMKERTDGFTFTPQKSGPAPKGKGPPPPPR